MAAAVKVGIVGGRGSGKSSLIVTLFRTVEPDGGVISLDGLDLQQPGPEGCLGRIAAIPHDPMLLNGTMRFDLDPVAGTTTTSCGEALGHFVLKVLPTLCDLSHWLCRLDCH